jgi:hypothetical protein
VAALLLRSFPSMPAGASPPGKIHNKKRQTMFILPILSFKTNLLYTFSIRRADFRLLQPLSIFE